MLAPTSGNAFVHGQSILHGMAAIRQSLGVCPQFDILWPEISVREHLQLYAAIKGYSSKAGAEAAISAAEDVGASLLRARHLPRRHSPQDKSGRAERHQVCRVVGLPWSALLSSQKRVVRTVLQLMLSLP